MMVWRRHFLVIEGVVAWASALAIWWWLHWAGIDTLVRNSDNIAIVSAFAQSYASILGFMVAAITFLFGIVDRERFAVLRASKSYAVHWQIFKGALTAAFCATSIGFGSLVLMLSGTVPGWMLLGLIGTGLWTGVRLGRVVWALLNMINGEVAAGWKSRSQQERRT